MSERSQLGGGFTAPGSTLENYLRSLVGRFFKILPLKENNDKAVEDYISSFQFELGGCIEFVEAIHEDAAFISLLSILEALMDETDIKKVRREVFRAISTCNKLVDKYAHGSEGGDSL